MIDILSGKITTCLEASAICGWGCCDQAVPTEGLPILPTDYIMMPPGEYDPDDPMQAHLDPVGQFEGGTIARCKQECFDQAGCNPDRNYKPLDCRSYPLMVKPDALGQLALVQDVGRCPLTTDDITDAHRANVLSIWQEAIGNNNDVLGYLMKLNLEGYQ